MKKYILYIVIAVVIIAGIGFFACKKQPVENCSENMPVKTEQQMSENASAVVENTNAQADSATESEPRIAYTAEVKVPVVKGQNKLNSLVLKQIKAIEQEFVNSMLVDDTELFNNATESVVASSYELNIYSDAIVQSKDYVSFIIYVYKYTGGAHGNTYMQPINYNIKTQKLVDLSEVINSSNPKWLEVLSQEAREKLVEKLDSKDDETIRWINEGTQPKLENFKNFKVDGDNIKFIFDAYQVAPYASGMPEVTIALEQLRK